MWKQVFSLLSFVFVLIYCITSARANNTNNPIVTTSLGTVEGSILISVGGKQIYSFRGIRYAKPPIGDLRFQPPVPVEKWDDIYDATEDGAMCPQPILTPVSEDCLFLNVYSTKLPNEGQNPKRPVIVYFHPGAYYSSTGSSVWAGPEYLLDKEIVLVTCNYRLASLGFLSTGDELAPGNNGLKDQVMVLRWVKSNIAAFGGDSDLVTICGYSVGGASVTLHLVSPMSKGLFHRAIAMSGSIYGNWPIHTHQLGVAQKQARLLRCPDNTSANIINCLKTKSSKELADSLTDFTEFGNNYPGAVWLPVVEPDYGQERFLTENPIILVQEGWLAKVPVMTGVTTDEFAASAFRVVGNATLLNQMDKEFERIAPITFIYERYTDNSKFISKSLRKFYLGEEPLNNASLPGLAKLYTDGTIGFGVNRAAKLLAEQNNENVYYYRFNYKERYSHFYWPGTSIPYGVVHNDDLIYMFYNSMLFPKFNDTCPEYAMVQKITTLIANFAKTGNPTPESIAELDYAAWQPFTLENNKYLDISNKLVMNENLYQERYTEWEKLFPLS